MLNRLMPDFKSRQSCRLAVIASLLAFCSGLVALPASGEAAVRLASWNIQRLGWGDSFDSTRKSASKKNAGNKNYAILAETIARFDLVAVQEVMKIEAISVVERDLERLTGESWSSMVSDILGEHNREAYAFVWRDSAVRYTEGAVVYLEPRGQNTFQREPYSAIFEDVAEGTRIALATVHVTFGEKKQDRAGELSALADYWSWLGEIYPGVQHRVLVGDFNMPPTEKYWDKLDRTAGARPLITKGATTVSTLEDGQASLYDNIWVDDNGALSLSASGILNLPDELGLSNAEYRRQVSDHMPVYATIGKSRKLLGSGQSGTSGAPTGTAVGQAATPIDPSRKTATAPGSSVLSAKTMSGAETAVAAPMNGTGTRISSGAGAGTEGPGVVANAKSKVYHLPHCAGYTQNGPNRLEFRSVQAAVTAGYRLAGNCK